MAGVASKYAVRPRFEQNRLPTAALVNFDEETFQTVTRKRKALGNLTESSVNAVAGRTRSGKVGRPTTSIKLADKEHGQQMIQFSSPSTDCTGGSNNL